MLYGRNSAYSAMKSEYGQTQFNSITIKIIHYSYMLHEQNLKHKRRKCKKLNLSQNLANQIFSLSEPTLWDNVCVTKKKTGESLIPASKNRTSIILARCPYQISINLSHS